MNSKTTIFNLFSSRLKNVIFNNQIKKNQKCCNYIIGKFYSSDKDELKEYKTPVENIRNFSIIAHVDHGKSTLADRLLEITGAIRRNSGAQVLDKLQVEKDRGITVKAQTVSLKYNYKGTEYLLNLIDTPGHVDFATEVHRSLAACQGVILLVDANDGVQAQTVANFYLAFGRDLVILPVINKIDLKNANPDRVVKQLETLFDIEADSVLKISAKMGINVDKVLETIVEKIPPPPVDRKKPFRALIFDSWFDRYKGAIALIYVSEGSLSVKQYLTSVHTGKSYEVKNIMLLRPEEENVKTLFAGQVGCVACNMRTTKEAFIGDTLHLKNQPVEPLVGFNPPKAMVFAGVYPMDQSQHVALRGAIEKLVLNDSAVSMTIETSPALGLGWRLGFLGLLHMEVFCQRLEQEHEAAPIMTAPSVTYKARITGKQNIKDYGGDEIYFNNPSKFPPPQSVIEFFEPMVLGTIITPDEYLGGIVSLCLEKRGVEQSTKRIDKDRLVLQFILPLNEVIIDFHDTLKSLSSGYASFDYEDNGYQKTDLVKLNVLLNGRLIEELSTIVHASKATDIAKRMGTKLLDIIPRQQFLVAIQITVGAKVLARENLKPFRKDVTGKLKSGGDVLRRRKLLQQQNEGKKKLRMVGDISLPRETFIDVLKR
ncbi:translation factor GUF1 homolog, mitochondrial [Microplitis mediator]|uniref:translation factor GUF1 homolog, mitochondrial n=1 Tax=Microplitis mediator TaxID=375433 RepID=UPI0025546E1F|nr:translation factor GUF1 homolog, mitochondrial [Microplitis mediator]